MKNLIKITITCISIMCIKEIMYRTEEYVKNQNVIANGVEINDTDTDIDQAEFNELSQWRK